MRTSTRELLSRPFFFRFDFRLIGLIVPSFVGSMVGSFLFASWVTHVSEASAPARRAPSPRRHAPHGHTQRRPRPSPHAHPGLTDGPSDALPPL